MIRIKLLSCKRACKFILYDSYLDLRGLKGSPIVVARNNKFDAPMENKITCDITKSDSPPVQQLISDAVIEAVSIEIPFSFQATPKPATESPGTRVLEQMLWIVLPRFMAQVYQFMLAQSSFRLVRDYRAWASGGASRQPLGTGQN